MADKRMEERKKFILAFKESLLCLEDEGDRADIMRSLKVFQSTMLVEDLVDSLKRALVTPQSLTVYVTLYPLIPGRLRTEYRTLIPKVPTFTVKIVRIRRNGTEPLGFTVRGGREHQLGIFITNVLPASRAYKSGLKPGHQILKINAFPLKESTHEEAVSLLTLKRAYILTCKDIGMIPEIRRNTVTWTYATDMEPAVISRPQERGTSPFQTGIRTVHCKLDGESMGCSIKGGAQHNMGIFIYKITPNSKAEELGLQVGDELIEVNGKSFSNLTQAEAVHFLRKQESFIMKIRPGDVMFRNRDSYQSNKSSGNEDALRDWRESTGGQFILRERDPSGSSEGPREYEDFFGEGPLAAPVFAQVIEGYGPTMALPGMTSMDFKSNNETEYDARDDEQSAYPGLIADVMRDNEIRRSISNFEEVIASATSTSKSEDVEADISAMLGAMQKKHLEDEREDTYIEKETRKPVQTKSAQQARRKAPTFKDSVDIIGISSGSHLVSYETQRREEQERRVSEFGEEVLEGRKQIQHSIPKNGPLKFSIQGGTDTVHGGKILISHIQEGGAAHEYGRLNVGDQILKVQGENLVGVTHGHAAMAVKTAMASNSPNLDMLVAQIPGGGSEGDVTDALSKI